MLSLERAPPVSSIGGAPSLLSVCSPERSPTFLSAYHSRIPSAAPETRLVKNTSPRSFILLRTYSRRCAQPTDTTFDPLSLNSEASSSLADAWDSFLQLFTQNFESTSNTRKEITSIRGAAAAIEDSSIDLGDFFKGPLPGKFLKLLGYLTLSRLGIYVPIGGINREAFIGNLDQNSFLSTLDSLSGGGIGRLGICSLGIVPFINAQIVFQLLTQIFPKLQDLQKKEGQAGRKKVLQYTRYASVGFAVVQAIGQVLYLRPYVDDFSTNWVLSSVTLLTVGSVFTTYIGEKISDLKLGNGTSLLIFTSIISYLPASFGRTISQGFQDGNYIGLITIVISFFILVLGIVYVQEAERKIPLNYASRYSSRSEGLQKAAYLPFKVQMRRNITQFYARRTAHRDVDPGIEFEDFANHNAFELLAKYGTTHLVFNDDIQGTASVVLAGIVAALKLVGGTIAEHTFLFLGAGEAGTGIAELIALEISKQTKASVEETRKKIWLVDSKGLIVKSRKESIQHFKKPWAHEHEPVGSLLAAVKTIKPTVLIGSSGVGKTFTKEVVEAMASFNEKPIILALSNPTTQSECTAEEAYAWSKGRALFASGSPFDPVELNGKVYLPGQANNAYIFPGFGLGLVISGAIRVHDEMLLAASEALAQQVTQDNLDKGLIYPPLKNIRKISAQIAANVAAKAYELGLASHLPRPADFVKYAESCMYSPVYRSYR